jgi:transposase-like protein
MSNGTSAPNRQYTDEFKLEAVRLAEPVGSSEAAVTTRSGLVAGAASATRAT